MIQYKFISSSPISLFFVLESASKFYFIFFTFFIVVQVQLSPFSPHHSFPLQPAPLPTLDPTCLWFGPCVLYTCSWKPFPFTPHHPLLPPLWLLLVCSWDFTIPSDPYIKPYRKLFVWLSLYNITLLGQIFLTNPSFGHHLKYFTKMVFPNSIKDSIWTEITEVTFL